MSANEKLIVLDVNGIDEGTSRAGKARRKVENVKVKLADGSIGTAYITVYLDAPAQEPKVATAKPPAIRKHPKDSAAAGLTSAKSELMAKLAKAAGLSAEELAALVG